MAPVLAELGGRGVDVGTLYVRRGSVRDAGGVGDRAPVVVITPGLVDATYHGGVTARKR